MPRARQVFIQFLRDNALRVSAGRLAIIDAVSQLESHFSQQDLLDELTASGNDVHRATVYRVLPLLEEAGIIRRVRFHDGAEARYEHHFAHRHHDHLRCVACGKVIEINRPALEHEKRAVCEQYDFEPIDHRFWVVGHCARCRREIQNESPTPATSSRSAP